MTKKAKILIVDDDIKFVNDLSRYLELIGYEAYKAGSGGHGIEVIEREKPDVLLCDLKMLDINGERVIKEAKAISPKTIPIMITGYSDERTEKRLKKIGAYTFVYKPIVLRDLVKTIKKAVENRG